MGGNHTKRKLEVMLADPLGDSTGSSPGGGGQGKLRDLSMIELVEWNKNKQDD